MKKNIVLILIILLGSTLAFSHFQMIYTPNSIIDSSTSSVDFILTFTHPFESGLTMDVGKNEAGEIKGFQEFYSIHKGKKKDLLEGLKKSEFTSAENTATSYNFTLDKSSGFRGGGDWVLVGVPYPYFEAADDGYLQQITKVFINKSSLSTDWSDRCCKGYPEIMPLVKPYEVFVGGVFSAVAVDNDGKPIPYAEIEYEYINFDVDMKENKFTGEKRIEKAGSGMLMANATGFFSFIPPKAGYWGFAALGAGKVKEFSGKPMSQDAVIWIEAFDTGIAGPVAENAGLAGGAGSSAEEEVTTAPVARPTISRSFSPAALIIVILLFIVLFAWPPMFKKLSEKKEAEEKEQLV